MGLHQGKLVLNTSLFFLFVNAVCKKHNKISTYSPTHTHTHTPLIRHRFWSAVACIHLAWILAASRPEDFLIHGKKFTVDLQMELLVHSSQPSVLVAIAITLSKRICFSAVSNFFFKLPNFGYWLTFVVTNWPFFYQTALALANTFVHPTYKENVRFYSLVIYFTT